MIELVRQIANLQRQVDGLIKPEVPLSGAAAAGLSLISETVLAADAASVTFSSIPQTFRNLLLITHARSALVLEFDLIRIRFNADATAIYDFQVLAANAATLSGVGTRADTSLPLIRCEAASSRANSFAPGVGWILSYTIAHEKWINGLSASFGDVSADTDMRMDYRTGRWRSTAAITSILLFANGGDLVSGSIFQLYGVT